MPSFVGPQPQQRGEVAGVTRHKDSALFGCELKDLCIGEPVQRGFLAQSQCIMAGLAEWFGDSLGGKVSVEKEAHVQPVDAVRTKGNSDVHSEAGRRFSATASSISVGYSR